MDDVIWKPHPAACIISIIGVLIIAHVVGAHPLP